MVKPDVPDPNYDDPKELYAFFGLAYYIAQLLEQGLINFCVALEAKHISGIKAKNIDDLYSNHSRQTFGHVLSIARGLGYIAPGLDDDLRAALEKRNYLAHHFFKENDENLLSEPGRKRMIDELREIAEFIKTVDHQFDEQWIAAWKPLGITEEWIEQEVEKAKQRASSA